MNILALDVGIAWVQAAIIALDSGQPVGPPVRMVYALDSPTPQAAEVPAARLWHTVAQAARTAVWHFGSPEISGIGLSVMMPSLVLLDKTDKPLAPIWTPQDRRARRIARQVWAGVGEEFLAFTEKRPLPGVISVLDYRRQLIDDPYLAHQVGSYLHVNGWLALHLTGGKAFDPVNASSTGLFGTRNDRTWSQRWCDYFEVEMNWLPRVVCSNTTIGHLRPSVAAELAVSAGVPVTLGIPDKKMEC